MIITFPWYPKELSPNSSKHYLNKAQFKKRYRLECYYHTKAAMVDYPVRDDYKALQITFYKPNNRHMDLDNMLASIKSGLDGMADALGVNDKCFKRIVIEVANNIGGYIEVEVI